MISDIAGVVVLYFPDEEELFRNISSYIEHLAVLYVIDNTGPKSGDSIYEKLSNFQKIQIIKNTKNEGIAKALNKAAESAFSKGFKWLLTMDQDSFFESDEGNRYFSFFYENFINKDNIAVVAPAHFKEMIDSTTIYSDLNAVLTSGDLIRLSVWNEINGFDEKLFIDEVDHDYCYRVKKAGYRIVQVNTIFLNHRLGTKTKGGYLGSISKRLRTIHTPQRVYFMVRNYLYVRKKYKRDFEKEFGKRDKALLVAIKNNLFFSGEFWANFRSIMKAYKDYRANNFSQTI